MGFVALALASAPPYGLLSPGTAALRVRAGLQTALDRLPHDHGVLPHFTHSATASVSDPAGAKQVQAQVRGKMPRLRLLWADGTYSGTLIGWVKQTCGWLIRLVTKKPGQTTFEVLPRRWVVERTFGWLVGYRRLVRDYECHPANGEAMIQVAMIHRMVRYLTC
jgi:transposase